MKREEYITDSEVVKRANAAVRLELEKRKAMGAPSFVYDRETGIIYQINSDGTRVEAAKAMRKGSYSERIAKEA